MPKNKGKGGKNRKKGKNDNTPVKRELLFKEVDQEYGIVVKMLGKCNMDIECADGVKRIGHVRGSMRKKVWVNMGDTVLVSLRDFQDQKADIIHVYNSDEVRCLHSYQELPEKWKKDTFSSSTSGVDLVGDGDDNANVTFDVDDV